MASFDADSSTIICDNSANVSICNDRNMFVGEMHKMMSHTVATIGGKGHHSSGIGTVKWSWSDDQGTVHEHLVKDVLYFPESPINILSVTAFAGQLGDPDGTGIDTKILQSRFYWDRGNFSRTIRHPSSNLPELSINEGFLLS